MFCAHFHLIQQLIIVLVKKANQKDRQLRIKERNICLKFSAEIRLKERSKQKQKNRCQSIKMSAVDEILNYQRSADEDLYGLLNCTEQATVSLSPLYQHLN